MRRRGSGPGARRARGVALITAMLVVALATVAAVAMTARQQLDIRRSGNLFMQDQALLYAKGAEDWSAAILMRDLRQGPTDHLGEDWSMVLPPLPIEGGQIIGRLEDLQGRFNLNNMVGGDEAAERAYQRFQRLLVSLPEAEISPEQAEELAQAVWDWIDPDEEAMFPGGAEDTYYLNLEPPYRTANGPLASASELRLIKGFTPEIYEAVEPYVTALPERLPVNVNTASAPVLLAAVDGMTGEEAANLLADRIEQPYDSVEDFLRQDALAGRQPANVAVATSYFLLTAVVEFGAARTELYSVLQRTPAGVRPVVRGQGAY